MFTYKIPVAVLLDTHLEIVVEEPIAQPVTTVVAATNHTGTVSSGSGTGVSCEFVTFILLATFCSVILVLVIFGNLIFPRRG
jgi:hypothetical protein